MKLDESKKHETTNLVQMWKEDVKWDTKTKKEKITYLWFGISAAVTFSFCWSWIAIPAGISLICSLASPNDIDVEE